MVSLLANHGETVAFTRVMVGPMEKVVPLDRHDHGGNITSSYVDHFRSWWSSSGPDDFLYCGYLQSQYVITE